MRILNIRTQAEGRPEHSSPHGEELEEADETGDLRPALLRRQGAAASGFARVLCTIHKSSVY